MMVDDGPINTMEIYGRTKNGKWHVLSGNRAKCSRNIKISQKDYFLAEPKDICERCAKRKVNLKVNLKVTEVDEYGSAPMEIEPDDFFEQESKSQSTLRKNVPKAVKDLLWNMEIGRSSGTGKCFVCPRIINSTTFKCGYIISPQNGGNINIQNLKCICYYCHRRQKDQNLRDYMNNFYAGRYEHLSIKKPIPKHTKIALWNKSYGSSAREANCYVCNKIITSTTFHAGHVIPESKGGTTDIGNLKCICPTCNLSMGDKNLEDFKRECFSKTSYIPFHTNPHNPFLQNNNYGMW